MARPISILQDVNLEIYPGEVVWLLGGNASGKSTTLKTILGIVKPDRGLVELAGELIQGRPTSYRIERGITVVPENRRIFGEVSVYENLLMGAYLRRNHHGLEEDLDRVLTLFPRLKDRLRQLGGTLSGGEQQMLALGQALMARPKLLLLDEPSMGLAPALVESSFQLIQQINRQGVAVFMVEQNAYVALSIADRGYVLQTGRLVLADLAKNLLNNGQVRQVYLGR